MRALLLLFLLPALLQAQSAYLKDKNIVWAAEIEQDWIIDRYCLSDESAFGLKTLKILRTDQNKGYWTYGSLSELVCHAASTGKLPIYEDAKCLYPADPLQVLSKADTVVTFSPETYEETVTIVKTALKGLANFEAWRLRQVLYYNKKTAGWNTEVVAIAPLLRTCCTGKDSVAYKPLFWFKPGNNRPSIESNSVVWAKITNNDRSNMDINTKQAHVVKMVDGFQHPIEQNLASFKNDPHGHFYSTTDDDKPILLKDRLDLISRSDTIVTFDPETYEEMIRVVHNDYNSDNIQSLRIVQTWYWDERKNRLSICTDKAGPIIDLFDYDGNLRFSRLLYYVKAK